jgi:hypothetical protein
VGEEEWGMDGKNTERLARHIALGQVEYDLRALNPKLDFYLVGQAHYGEVGFAFIEVYGIDDQTERRRIRREAGERLEKMGFPVGLIDTKDVFNITPISPDEKEAR